MTNKTKELLLSIEDKEARKLLCTIHHAIGIAYAEGRLDGKCHYKSPDELERAVKHNMTPEEASIFEKLNQILDRPIIIGDMLVYSDGHIEKINEGGN